MTLTSYSFPNICTTETFCTLKDVKLSALSIDIKNVSVELLLMEILGKNSSGRVTWDKGFYALGAVASPFGRRRVALVALVALWASARCPCCPLRPLGVGASPSSPLGPVNCPSVTNMCLSVWPTDKHVAHGGTSHFLQFPLSLLLFPSPAVEVCV